MRPGNEKEPRPGFPGRGSQNPARTYFRAVRTIIGPKCLTAVFGMGTGVATWVWSPERHIRRMNEEGGTMNRIVVRSLSTFSEDIKRQRQASKPSSLCKNLRTGSSELIARSRHTSRGIREAEESDDRDPMADDFIVHRSSFIVLFALPVRKRSMRSSGRLLVPVGSEHCCSYTSGLSTW